jgi:hypothetical protein
MCDMYVFTKKQENTKEWNAWIDEWELVDKVENEQSTEPSFLGAQDSSEEVGDSPYSWASQAENDNCLIEFSQDPLWNKWKLQLQVTE